MNDGLESYIYTVGGGSSFIFVISAGINFEINASFTSLYINILWTINFLYSWKNFDVKNKFLLFYFHRERDLNIIWGLVRDFKESYQHIVVHVNSVYLKIETKIKEFKSIKWMCILSQIL